MAAQHPRQAVRQAVQVHVIRPTPGLPRTIVRPARRRPAGLHVLTQVSLCSACRYDKYCPFYKSCDMLRNMILFYTW